jgi:4-amino-4-deoxy-L-arabinose transferase-like glycosyltransferase
MVRASRAADRTPPPILPAIVALATVTKVTHHHPHIRTAAMVLLVALGAVAVDSFWAHRVWRWWQIGGLAIAAVVGSWWIAGGLMAGVGLPLAASLLALAWRGSRQLRARIPFPEEAREAAARVRTWATSAAVVPPDDGGPRATRARIVGDLVAVFLIALGVRGVWALVVPPWEAPDEPTHFVITAHIVDQGEIPRPRQTGNELTPEISQSAEMTYLRRLSGVGAWLAYELPYLPVDGDYTAARAYAATRDARRSAGPVTDYPPLYHLLAAVPYALAKHAPILSRLFAVRLTSVLLGALSCLAAYGIAFEVRHSRRWGLALGLAMALMPMYSFITAVANNDAALDALATVLIWLIVRTMRRAEVTRSQLIALSAVSGAALLTKTSAIVLVLVAGAALLLKRRSACQPVPRAVVQRLATLAVFAAGPLLLYGPWVIYRYRTYHQLRLLTIPFPAMFRALVGVPPTAAVFPPIPPATLPAFAALRPSPWWYLHTLQGRGGEYFHRLLLESVWGNFGWLDAPLPGVALRAIAVACALGAVGVALQFALQPSRRRGLALLAGIVAVQVLFLFIGVDYYLGYVQTGNAFGLQGRYFFPALAPFLLLLLSGWDCLWRGNPIGLRVALVGMGVLQAVGLATIATRYYGVGVG